MAIFNSYVSLPEGSVPKMQEFTSARYAFCPSGHVLLEIQQETKTALLGGLVSNHGLLEKPS